MGVSGFIVSTNFTTSVDFDLFLKSVNNYDLTEEEEEDPQL